MDEADREQWKWKYYRVVIHLNAVIIGAGLVVLAVILVPDPHRVPSAGILLAIEVILIFTFIRNYQATKGWLETHGNAGKSE